MHISVIIPTYNEADNIGSLVSYLKRIPATCPVEVIVADGGSSDATLTLATAAGADAAIISPVKGRAGQMNYGTSIARGDTFYFVHADTRPSESCFTDIEQAAAAGYNCGSYRFKFDSNNMLLKMNAFFTRFNYLFFRGGDQSIFVTRELFKKVGAFNDELKIMEDYDFLEKVWNTGKFKLVSKATLVSARKYETNSWLRVQLANLKVVKMYKSGASQQDMIDTYKRMLNYRKNAF